VAPNILTGPLRINAFTRSDARALFLYRSDPRVTCFQSRQPKSLEEIRAFLVRNASTPFDQEDSWHQLAVRFAATGELIGDLGVHLLGGGGQVEIGFTIAPVHQRRGFGTLAVTALLDHLFTVLKKHRVFASVDPRNIPSIALLRRIGMRQEAHFRQSLFWRGEWVDDLVFALLRSEWNASDHRGNTVVDCGTSQP
jgi:RimJ/RimL family protein N-acetyltransferase